MKALWEKLLIVSWLACVGRVMPSSEDSTNHSFDWRLFSAGFFSTYDVKDHVAQRLARITLKMKKRFVRFVIKKKGKCFIYGGSAKTNKKNLVSRKIQNVITDCTKCWKCLPKNLYIWQLFYVPFNRFSQKKSIDISSYDVLHYMPRLVNNLK